MKILFFTDTHIKSRNPRSRIDDYEDSIYKKIEEIKNVDGIGDKTFESLKSLITID
mgnify:CR=1 FL=1